MHSTPFTVPGITTAIDVGKTKLDAHVASPRTSRNFVRSIGKEARNDLTDSGVLAVFSRLQLAETCEPKAETQKQVDHMGTPHHLMDCPGALRMASRGFFKDAANSMHRSIEATMEDIACLDTRIAAQMRSQEGRKRRSEIIRSVPGRGAQTAAVLCAEMPEAGAVGQARPPSTGTAGRVAGRKGSGRSAAYAHSAVHGCGEALQGRDRCGHARAGHSAERPAAPQSAQAETVSRSSACRCAGRPRPACGKIERQIQVLGQRPWPNSWAAIRTSSARRTIWGRFPECPLSPPACWLRCPKWPTWHAGRSPAQRMAAVMHKVLLAAALSVPGGTFPLPVL